MPALPRWTVQAPAEAGRASGVVTLSKETYLIHECIIPDITRNRSLDNSTRKKVADLPHHTFNLIGKYGLASPKIREPQAVRQLLGY